jgi:hypothetical protein
MAIVRLAGGVAARSALTMSPAITFHCVTASARATPPPSAAVTTAARLIRLTHAEVLERVLIWLSFPLSGSRTPRCRTTV